jgi:Zn-finger nucleic acid-binding protein
MEQVTCPNCNVDVEPEELKRNNLHCPTCGFDLSDAGEVESLVADEELDDEKDDDEDKEDEDEDDEDEEE